MEQMKESMHQQHGFPPGQFRFVWKGKQLELHETLSECGIVADSLLHVVIDTSGNKSHEQKRKPAPATAETLLIPPANAGSNTELLIPPTNTESSPDPKCCIIL